MFFIFRASFSGSTGSRFNSSNEISFSKTLALSPQGISIDEGLVQAVPCSGDRKSPAFIGYIKTPKGDELKISCTSDYMGGISLSYVDGKGTPHSIDLSQSDGDAGDVWDTRAWISRDTKDGVQKLVIRIVTLTSSEALDSGSLKECSMNKIFYAWDPDGQRFIEDPADTEFDLPPFPDSKVASGCFDDKGNWTGR